MLSKMVMKPKDQWWREAYHLNRYLAGKSDAHIVTRLRYLIETILTLSPTGKIGIEGQGELGEWLLARLTHTREEMALRGMQPPDGFLVGAHVPRVAHPNPPAELTSYERRSRSDPGQVFKFGKKKYLIPALKEGSLRFSGARSYEDPSLNSAIQDDEISLTIYPTQTSTIPILGTPTMAADDGLTLTHHTDYYVQCFSTRHTLRMYEDFSADCCLIIYDAREFGNRIFHCLRARFPDWIVGSIPVSYVDPDDPGHLPLPIPAAKHMKYAYQREERIICHSKSETFNQLQPFTVKVGSLEDIAELIEVEGSHLKT